MSTIVVHSQIQPSEHASHGYELKKLGEIDQAINAYKQDYLITHNPRSVVEIAALYSLIDSRDSAFHWLNLLLKNHDPINLFREERFYNLLEYPEWVTFEQSYMPILETFEGEIRNVELTKRLWRLGIKDQAYSYEGNLASQSMGENSPVTKAILRLQEINRAENLSDIDIIINEYGLPRRSDVGSSAASVAFSVIQHASDPKARANYLESLKLACEENEADWENYAMMYDRLLVETTGKQLYGTQFTMNVSNQLELSPIDMPEYVEKRRRDLGLKPLKDKLERMGISFDVIQIE